LVAWHLGRCPGHQIIAATHSDKLAIDNSRDVLDYVNDEYYRTLFPGTELKSDNKGASGWRTTKGGSYKPLGVGAGIAGYGSHILIIDDPHRDKDAYSEAVRDNIWRWYKSSARTRLMPGGGQLVIQTRWVLDDLTGRLIEEEGRVEDGGKWEVVCYPAIAEEDEWRTPTGRIVHLPSKEATLLRRKGEALHPQRYNVEALNEHRKDAVVWAALYQQNPTAGEAAVFKMDEIKVCSTRDIPKKLSHYTAADFALSTAQRGDFCVLMHAGVDEKDNLWIVDVERGKWDAYEICERLIESWLRFHQDVIGIEKNHMEMAIAPFLDKLVAERGLVGFGYEALEHGNKDKLTRARPIQARMRQGKVFIPNDAPWSDILFKELMEFPVGRHDDTVDALAWLGQMLDTMLPAVAERRANHTPSWQQKLKAKQVRGWKTS
jgi:predicted phage terminase large subunit-like protein